MVYSNTLICILDESLVKIEIWMATSKHDEPAVDANYIMLVSAVENAALEPGDGLVMDTMTANTTFAVWTVICSTTSLLAAYFWELAIKKWYRYWTIVGAVEDGASTFRAMTVKWLCDDGIVRDFLFDTGAAASLVPTTVFSRVCKVFKLRPSRLELRAANGQTMPSEGRGVMEMRIPGMSMDEPALIQHEFEVMPKGSIPSSLKIMGVDFWDKLNPCTNWREKKITCTAPDGRKFDLPFSVSSEKRTTIGSVSAQIDEHAIQLRLREDLHLRPREHREVVLVTEGAADMQKVHSLHSTMQGDCMWDNVIVEVEAGGSFSLVKHILHNTSKTETMSCGAGQTVAILQSHESIETYLDSECSRKELPAWINYVVTEPVTWSKNNQQTKDLDDDSNLLKGPEALHQETVENLKEPKFAEEYEEWCSKVGSQFSWGSIGTDAEKEYWLKVLHHYRELFNANPKAPPPIDGVECALYFKEANPKPSYRPPPKVTREEKEYMDKDCDTMLRNGIIGFADSEWATVPVFAKKKPDPVTGISGLRTAIDFRGLNSCLAADRLAMPYMDEVLDSLSEAACYSTFDISSGFWGIRVRKADQKYLAFHGFWKGAWHLFSFLRMPFGLKCSTTDFSRCYQKILGPTKREPKGLLDVISRVWVDDNVVYSKQTKDHLSDVCKVLNRLIANRMSIKPSKCIWLTDILPFLGHLVLAGKGVKPDTDKVKSMLLAKPPEDVAALRTFIGQSVWLAKHIEDYSRLISPLRAIVNRYPAKEKADISHIWGEESEALCSFNAVKVALCAQPLLAFPRFDRPFILLVDASGDGYGGCLAQLDDDGVEVPIAYASTSLNKAQKSYTATGAEAAAMMYFLRKWRHLIQATSSTTLVITDHSAVCSLTDPKKEFTNRRLANYAAELGDLNIAIAHRSGRVHYTADWLSRCKHETDETVLKELYSKLEGDVALVAKKIGLRNQHILFSKEMQQARLKHSIESATVMGEVRKDGTGIKSVKEFVAAVQSGDWMQGERHAGEEYEPTLLNEYYELIAPIGTAVQDWDMADVLKAQRADAFCNNMCEYLKSGIMPRKLMQELVEPDTDYESGDGEESDDSKARDEAKRIATLVVTLAPHFTISSAGLLLRLHQKKGNKHQQLAQELQMVQQLHIPTADKELQRKIVTSIHTAAGHPGTMKTYQILQRTFSWGGMYMRTAEIVGNCTKCQYHSYKAPAAPLMGHTTAHVPAEVVALDIIHLPLVAGGHRYLLTGVDVFSRFGFAVPLKKIDTASVLMGLKSSMLPIGLGKPGLFLLDGGPEFKDQIRQAIQAWDSKARVHAPHHHESAGTIEIFNKTIEKKIGLLLDG